jgi:hypothetical protein
MAGAVASDGDVNYVSPYITVDPETGKLITVNPGPELKVHKNNTAPANTPTATTTASVPGLTDPALTTYTGQDDNLMLKISVIAGGILAILALAGWWVRQNQTNARSL